jgi:hypothetical protein
MCSWASVLTSSKENEKTIRTTTALKKSPQILARAPSTLATLDSILNSDLNTHINCCLRLLLSIPHAKIWEQIWEDYTKCRRPSHKDPSLTSCSSLVHKYNLNRITSTWFNNSYVQAFMRRIIILDGQIDSWCEWLNYTPYLNGNLNWHPLKLLN